MKLQAVAITNYKSIKSLELPSLGPLTVFVGRNNSGKSNTAKSIHHIFDFFKIDGLVKLAPWHVGISATDDSSHFMVAEFRIDEPDEIEELATNIGATAHSDVTSAKVSVTVRSWLEAPVCAVLERVTIEFNSTATSESVVLFDLSEVDSTAVAATYRQWASDSADLTWFSTMRTPLVEITEAMRATVLAEIRRGKQERFPPSDGGEQHRIQLAQQVKNLAKSSANFLEFLKNFDSLVADKQRAADEKFEIISQILGGAYTSATEFDEAVGYIINRIGQLNVRFLPERRTQVSEKEALHLLELRVSSDTEHVYENIKEATQRIVGVRMQPYRKKGTKPGSPLAGELQVDGFELDVNGTGIKEALSVLLDVEINSPDLLIIEEPEVHLHPGLERQVLAYIRNAAPKLQTIITTHSTNFIDTSDSTEVYVFSRNDANGTVAKRFKADRDVRLICSELGLRLNAMLMYERLVFVEGDSDIDILRTIAGRTGANLAEAGVGFVKMGGVRNMSYFAASETMDFLYKKNVAMTFIIDHDEKSEEEINKIRERLSGKAKLHVLECRQIENYLLAVPAVTSLINEKRLRGGIKGGDVEENSVQTAMADEIEKLFFPTVEKRVKLATVRPLNPDRRLLDKVSNESELVEAISRQLTAWKSRINDIELSLHITISSEEKKLKENWISDKWKLVSGAALLDATLGVFQVAFDKANDGKRLAELCAADDFPGELPALIRGLVE